MPVGGVLELGELPGVHAAGAQVADLAGLHDVVQGLHGLLEGSVGIEAVDLVEVDVVGPEPGQRGVDLLEVALRDSPWPPGPSCILPCTLVARTISSRRAYRLIARPTSSSEVPCW